MQSHRRLWLVVVVACLLVAVVGIAVLVWPAPKPTPSRAVAAPEVVRGRLLSFRIVEHRAHSVVAMGHAQRFTLASTARSIKLDGLGRCAVIKRSARSIVLRSPLHEPVVLRGVHDVIYEGLDFEGAGSGWGAASGVIYIDGATHNVTFRDCVIGTNQDGVGNGVKIVDSGRGMHDITFDHCTFRYQPKMGFECIGRADPAEGGTGGRGYQRVDILHCTFEPGAGQAISYDDDYSDVKPAGHCLVAYNRVLGGGVGDSYQYGSVIENNGVHDMTWQNNYFGAGRDSIVNLSGRDDKSLNMVSKGNVYDASYVAPGIQPHNQMILMRDIAGGVTFADRIINDPSTYDGVWAYLSNCNGVDFGASSVENISGESSEVYGSGNSNIVWPVAR
jgi:hypothetical protein